MTNHYTNQRTNRHTIRASEALQWHRDGDTVEVLHYDADACLSYVVEVQGAVKKNRDENREHCRLIAEELDAYAEGRVHRCPECDAVIQFPDGVGDKFKCPHCHEVSDAADFECLGIHDYFDDFLDIDYVVNYRKEYKAVRVLVAFGGPNIYIDTMSGCVELYWWTETAKYRLLSDTINAIDEWAEEYYNCLRGGVKECSHLP